MSGADLFGQPIRAGRFGAHFLAATLYEAADRANGTERDSLMRQAARAQRQAETRDRRNMLARQRYAARRDARLPGPSLFGGA